MLRINDINRIHLGCQGENNARTITINVSDWLTEFPAGIITIWNRRNGENVEYEPTGVVFDDVNGTISWTPTGNDTFYAGTGVCGICLKVGRVIKKSRNIETFVTESADAIPAADGNVFDYSRAANRPTIGNVELIGNRELNELGLSVKNNLVTTEAGHVLDARQGKVLDEKKLNIADVANDLTTTEEGKALDARQGYVLDEKKVNRHTGLEEGKFLQTDENGDAVWGSPASEEVIRDAAEGWMEDHVSQGETLAIDNTLTLSGYAADSKVTGDKLTELKSAVVESNKELYKIPLELIPTSGGTFSLASGGLNGTTGANTTQTSRSRCSLFDIKPGYSYMVELTDPTYYIVNGFGYSSTSTSSSKTGKMMKIDEWHQIYHAEDTAICARCSFGITADNTQAMTDSDRTAILAAFKVYTLTDESLSVGGAPADAKKTGEVKIDLNTLKNAVADEETVEWSDAGTESYPNGWAKGYYSPSDGDPVASNVYIRSNSTYFYEEENATLMEVFAPAGYAVKVYEYKPDGTFVDSYGSISNKEIGNHLFFEFEKGHKFRFAMGRFEDAADCETHYGDTSFLASCVVNFYSLGYGVLEEQINSISENLDAIFYTEKITFTADQWRTGYYKASTGIYTTSYKYICTKSNVTVANPNMTRLTAKAPEGYCIAAFEFASNGDFVARHGNMKQTNEINVAVKEGSVFRFAIGQFKSLDAGDYLTDEFIGQIQVSVDELKIMDSNTKLNRTGDFEWFTVTVDRPLSFGKEEVIDPEEAQEIECVLRLPTSYTRAGTPTRLVLACHGASGYVKSPNTWYNSYWKDLMDSLLAAGYAVFDANVLPTSTGTELMGRAVGSPLYVNVLKKAYDYIVYNYNVYPEIFAHGTSMGGVGATAFSHTYPNLVLAESSFAGRDVLRYIYSLNEGDGTERFAKAYGYASLDSLTEDHFSHVDGISPSLSLRKVNNDGTITMPPDRETAYSDWLDFWSEVANHERNDDVGIWIGNRSVPYKAWNAWADNESYTKLEEILKQAYTAGSACPYYTVEYDISDEEVAQYREQFQNPDLTRHSFMSYGMIYDMREQLIAWYKRWE